MEEARLRELASVQMEKQREKVQRKPWPYISLKKKKKPGFATVGAGKSDIRRADSRLETLR